MTRRWLAVLLLLFPCAGFAQDGVALELGRGEKDLTLVRVAATWEWQRRWFENADGRYLGGYWELSGGGWGAGQAGSYDVGLTPVFRYARDGAGPYVEAAIGFRFVFDRHVARDRVFSTRFQFGDHVALGARFGERARYDLSLRLQHLSNASIDKPNPGLNFLILRFAARLD